MSKTSAQKRRAMSEARYQAGLCVKCGCQNDSFNPAGRRWRACPSCRNEAKLEARATKNILYPPIPPKIVTAADVKLTPLAERLIHDAEMSRRLYHTFARRGLEVEA